MDDPHRLPTPESEPEALELEVTALASGHAPASHLTFPRDDTTRDRIARSAFATGAVLLALVVVFAGISSFRGTIPSAQPTPTNAGNGFVSAVVIISNGTDTGSTSATPGAVSNCPPGNAVGTFAPSFQPGAGLNGLNAYFIGFDGPQAHLHLAGAATTPHGWAAKLVLAAASDVVEPLTLSGQGFGGAGNGPLWLSARGPDQAAEALTFDPSTVTPTATGWTIWPFQLYIPAAGCYFLQVGYFNTTTGTYFSAGQ